MLNDETTEALVAWFAESLQSLSTNQIELGKAIVHAAEMASDNHTALVLALLNDGMMTTETYAVATQAVKQERAKLAKKRPPGDPLGILRKTKPSRN